MKNLILLTLAFSLSVFAVDSTAGTEVSQTPTSEAAPVVQEPALDSNQKVIVLGGGPAGMTACIYLGNAGLKPVNFEGPRPAGGLMAVAQKVHNFPIAREIDGTELAQQIHKHAEEVGTIFVNETITQADLSTRPFTLKSDADREYTCEYLVIATGAEPRKLGVEGESTYDGRGIGYCSLCDALAIKGKPTVVIGGGTIALKLVQSLLDYTSEENITLVHDGEELVAAHDMMEFLAQHPKVKVLLKHEVVQFKGDGNQLSAVVVRDLITGKEKTLRTNGAFIGTGLKPSTDIFKGQLEMTEEGKIVTAKGGRTSREGVYAAGIATGEMFQVLCCCAGGAKAAVAIEEDDRKQKGLSIEGGTHTTHIDGSSSMRHKKIGVQTEIGSQGIQQVA